MKQITTQYLEGKKARTEEIVVSDASLRTQEKDLINLYPEITYQRIEGFGGAFTDAAGYVFSQMPKDLQDRFIHDYFSGDGLGYTCGRTSVDS